MNAGAVISCAVLVCLGALLIVGGLFAEKRGSGYSDWPLSVAMVGCLFMVAGGLGMMFVGIVGIAS